MQSKVLICLPKYVVVDHFNAAEKARFQRLQADLIVSERCNNTVVLKNLATVAYNGRMGKVMGVSGARTVVMLLPDGETRSFPTANTSICENGLHIMMVKDAVSLQHRYLAGDKVVFFDTDAILQQGSAGGSASAVAPTMQLWMLGPYLPTEKVMAFWDLQSEFRFPEPFRNQAAIAIVNIFDGPMTMLAENATQEQLNAFCTLVQDITDSGGGDQH